MNIKTRIIATSCVIVLWFNNLIILAQTQQNPNLDFGNPTTEEMKMTSCSVEPNAPAVVLCKLDNVNYEIRDNDFCVVYDIKGVICKSPWIKVDMVALFLPQDVAQL